MDKGKGNYSYHTLVTWVYFRFLTTGLATTHLCCSGPEICFHTTGLLYIRLSYNRKILSNNKEQLLPGPCLPLSYIQTLIHPVFCTSGLYCIMKFPVECTPKKCYTFAKEPECVHNNCHDFHSSKIIFLRVVAKNRNEERESRCWPVNIF